MYVTKISHTGNDDVIDHLTDLEDVQNEAGIVKYRQTYSKGIIGLQPDVFNYPVMLWIVGITSYLYSIQINQNHIAETLKWQERYKTVDMSFEQSRLETGDKRGWKVRSI